MLTGKRRGSDGGREAGARDGRPDVWEGAGRATADAAATGGATVARDGRLDGEVAGRREIAGRRHGYRSRSRCLGRPARSRGGVAGRAKSLSSCAGCVCVQCVCVAAPEHAGRPLDLASNRAATARRPCSPPSLPATSHPPGGAPPPRHRDSAPPPEPTSRPPPPQPQQQHTPTLPELPAPPLAAGKWLGDEVDGEEEEERRLMVRQQEEEDRGGAALGGEEERNGEV